MWQKKSNIKELSVYLFGSTVLLLCDRPLWCKKKNRQERTKRIN